MRRPLRWLLAAGAAAALGACTWVKLEPQGAAVQVARGEQDLSYCQRLGQVTTSVKDRVGAIERSGLKVHDEVESLARNEAASMGGDTVQPASELRNGEQQFSVYRCR